VKTHTPTDVSYSATVSTTPAANWCRTLSSVRLADATLVGGKAAALGTAIANGLMVPPGIVLTVDAYDAWGSGLDDDGRITQTRAGLRATLASALAGFGSEVLAVRSSAIGEDGAEDSFAGTFTTVLSVQGTDAVIDAVLTCWASARNARAASYRESRGIGTGARMAVLIQRQVPAVAAGVAFSSDPVTGASDHAVVNAVASLGQTLVDGSVTPEAWRVDASSPTLVRALAAPVLTPAQAVQVAALARTTAGVFGSPQDIEWAYEDGVLWLLQSRPITTLEPDEMPEPPPDTSVPAGFWERNDTYYPHPLSPMFRSFFLGGLTAAYERFFAECGALALRAESREIGGWVYMRVVPLGGRDVPPLPSWLMWLACHTVPQIRRRIADAVTARRTDRFGQYAIRWASHLRPDLVTRSDAFQRRDLTALADDTVAAHLFETVAFVRETLEVHFLVVGAHFFALAEFAFWCRDVLGWDEGKCIETVAGLSSASTAPSGALRDLATCVLAEPDVKAALFANAELDVLRGLSASFRAGFDAYLAEFGHRVLRYEVAEPTLAERPELVLRWLRLEVQRTPHVSEAVPSQLADRRADCVAEGEALAARRGDEAVATFRRLLDRARLAYPLREDNEVVTLSAPLALVRYAALELGRRMVARRQLRVATDVFQLELRELESVWKSGAPAHSLVRARRRQAAWVRAHPGPRSYGREPKLPARVAGLPFEADFVFQASLWMRQHGFAPSESARAQADARRLTGLAASRGSYTGRVCVVHDETQFHKLRPGDVLVSPITAPVWSVLFPSVGALVTDTGGVLSHSAIIAREYGIPAVVATAQATRLLRDDDLVLVDGDGGCVMVLDASH
jgi:phosphohistidine swiveling domain-containing protein